MSRYLLIESRDPFDSNDAAAYCGLACATLRVAARRSSSFSYRTVCSPLVRGWRASCCATRFRTALIVLADDFSLRERGIPAGGSRSLAWQDSPLDRVVIDEMAAGAKVMWH